MTARGPVKVFILNADPDIQSDTACRKVVKASLEVLQTDTYQVFQTDIVKDGWLEPMSVNDFAKVSDPVHINLRIEQQISPLIQKIQDEQTKFLQCDFFILFTPLSTFGPSSHFFAWWERVVTFGRCYGPGLMYETGALARKHALVVVTTSMKEENFGRDTLYGTIEEILYPVTHGMLSPLGFTIYRSQCLFFNDPKKTDETLNKWQTALHDIDDSSNSRTKIIFNAPKDYVNWQLATPEKERMNDMALLNKSGDMTLKEATMKLNSTLD